jgi:FAD synthase
MRRWLALLLLARGWRRQSVILTVSIAGIKRLLPLQVAAARRDSLLPSVITFDPHPREFFRQDEAPFHLADRREKDRLLAGLLGQMGPARVIHIRFDDALRSTSADQFVSDILAGLGVRQLYAGTDFAFGKGRGGDLQTINQVGKPLGISATAVPLACRCKYGGYFVKPYPCCLAGRRTGSRRRRCLAMIGR